MTAPLDELYLTWLYSQVGSVKLRDRRRTYWSLLRLLYRQEFTWHVFNDDNRVADGQELRHRFMREEGLVDVDPVWVGLECSVLEMLIALCDRLVYQAGGDVRTWFWHLMDNLELHQFSDRALSEYPDLEEHVKEVVECLVQRNYRRDGRGGLFPLRRPKTDQRRVEIWYQMHAYLLENY